MGGAGSVANGTPPGASISVTAIFFGSRGAVPSRIDNVEIALGAHALGRCGTSAHANRLGPARSAIARSDLAKRRVSTAYR